MSLPKKILSTFLAVLLLVFSFSTGLHAFALAGDKERLYADLANVMKNHYVAKEENYSVKTQKDYSRDAWFEENGSFKTVITVFANDNLNGDIYNAATAFMKVVDYEIVYKYGTANYDFHLLEKSILTGIKTAMGDSDYVTYNVENIVPYFLATAPSINSSNFFDVFRFVSSVDIEAALLSMDIDEVEYIASTIIDYKLTAEFNCKREWDELTATKPYYSFKSFSYSTSTLVNNTLRDTIVSINDAINALPNYVWDASYFADMINNELNAWRATSDGSAFMSIISNLKSLSDELAFHFFGDKIGDLMYIHGATQGTNVYPKRDNVHSKADGSPSPYEIDQAMMDRAVVGLESLFASDDMESVISTIADMLPFDISGAKTINDIIKMLVSKMLFSDDIVNMFFGIIYPMFAEALYGIEIDNPMLDGEKITLTEDNFTNIKISPDSFAAHIGNATYPDVYNALINKTSWNDVTFADVKWNINGDINKFANVVTLILTGLGDALNLLMAKGSVDVDLTLTTTVDLPDPPSGSIDVEIPVKISITGCDTYNNLVVPFFTALGITPTDIDSSSITQVIADAIVDPFVNWIKDSLFKTPLTTILTALPNLAYYINFADYSPAELLTGSGDFSLNFNIGVDIGEPTLPEDAPDGAEIPSTPFIPDIAISLGDSLSGYADKLGDLNTIIQKFASLSGISIPYLMIQKLANIGTWTDTGKDVADMDIMKVNANKGDVLLYLLRSVLSSLLKKGANGTTLLESLGLDSMLDGELIGGLSLGSIIMNTVYNYDDVICAACELTPGNTVEYDANYVNYHFNVLYSRGYNRSFGPPVKYSQYWTRANAVDVAINIDGFIDNILAMLKLDGYGSMNEILGGFISGYVYSNELLTTIAKTIYVDLLGQIGGSSDGILGNLDLLTIVNDVLGIDFDSSKIGIALESLLGTATGISSKMITASSWDEVFAENLDWGFARNANGKRVNTALEGMKDSELFTYSIAAILSPLAPLAKYLLTNENLKLFNGRIELPGSAGYDYSIISLFEAFCVPSNYIDTYAAYSAKASDPVTGDVDTFVSLIKPITGLIDTVIASPVTTILSMIPNVLFVASIGGFNDIINNLLQPIYVLFDILEPVVDLESIIESLLAGFNLDSILPISLNFSFPVDIDFNSLINGLLDTYLGTSQTFNIAGVPFTLNLPYLDFASLSAGNVVAYDSKTGREALYLDSARGADLLTVLMRYAMDILFMTENVNSLNNVIISSRNLGPDDAATLIEMTNFLAKSVVDIGLPDMSLLMFAMFVSMVVPVVDEIGARFKQVDFSITELLASVTNMEVFMGYVEELMDAGEPNQTLTGFAKIIEMLKNFFTEIGEFFRTLFGG